MQRWVVGCAGARALPSLQLLTAPNGVRSVSRQAEPPNGDFANCIDGLAGSLLGFLLWNCSPAKVFMGDVGSTFLCAVFVGLVYRQPAGRRPSASGGWLVPEAIARKRAPCGL